MEWTNGMDYWTGLLNCTTGLDYCMDWPFFLH